MDGCSTRSLRRSYLLTQYEPNRCGVRGEDSTTGDRRICNIGIYRNGSDIQHIARPVESRGTCCECEGHLRRHKCRIRRIPPKYGIDVELCDTTDFDAIEGAISKGCDLLYLETPTNPTLKILDLDRLATAGHREGAIVVVDNTFATPINQTPIDLGADLVVHSATKFLGGHADALGGVVVGSEALVAQIFHYREINGATLHPMAAYLLLRGMKTLELRVQRQNSSAQTIAEFLHSHPKVESVNYPGLTSHAHHDVAARQMRGFGGMLSFSIGDDLRVVRDFLPRLRFAHSAANLGSVETIVGPPATTSHVECSAEERAALGIPEGLIRYSTGIENIDDLLDDLDAALDSI